MTLLGTYRAAVRRLYDLWVEANDESRLPDDGPTAEQAAKIAQAVARAEADIRRALSDAHKS